MKEDSAMEALPQATDIFEKLVDNEKRQDIQDCEKALHEVVEIERWLQYMVAGGDSSGLEADKIQRWNLLSPEKAKAVGVDEEIDKVFEETLKSYKTWLLKAPLLSMLHSLSDRVITH